MQIYDSNELNIEVLSDFAKEALDNNCVVRIGENPWGLKVITPVVSNENFHPDAHFYIAVNNTDVFVWYVYEDNSKRFLISQDPVDEVKNYGYHEYIRQLVYSANKCPKCNSEVGAVNIVPVGTIGRLCQSCFDADVQGISNLKNSLNETIHR